MEESVPIRSRMLETYSTWFALLMKCLLVSAGLLTAPIAGEKFLGGE